MMDSMEHYDYSNSDIIGVGSYGRVYKATEKKTGNKVALKLIDKSNYTREERKSFIRECRIHTSLHHPNIIQMLNSFETVEHIVVVTELADIDLHKFLAHTKLSEKHVQRLSWNLLSALYYIHSERTLHRDLKPQNILLNKCDDVDVMEAKLCDFGLARNMTSGTYLLTSVKGTPLYMAPEVFSKAPYDEKADLWSVGCVLYEALFKKPPFKAQSLDKLKECLEKTEIIWPVSMEENCKSFIQGLLKKDPKLRFTWSDILNHPYVKGHLLILDNNTTERPLTNALTASQKIEKEKQRDEIIFYRGKKMIADAMNKCQQSKSKVLQKQMDRNNPNKFRKPQHQLPNIIGDDESLSSQDSINAIVQTDLETDVEGPGTSVPKALAGIKMVQPPVTEFGEFYDELQQNPNLMVKRFAENFAISTNNKSDQQPESNANANLMMGPMTENFRNDQINVENQSKVVSNNPKQTSLHRSPVNVNQQIRVDSTAKNYQNDQQKKNKDLEKRKLSQNLDNFSIRLGNSMSSNEKTLCRTNAKAGRENEVSDAIDVKLDTYDDYQSSPIENEEWLAFIQTFMQEVLDGEIDSLKHQKLVGIIVAILRNFSASSKVIESVVQLLSIPFVLPITEVDLMEIKNTYVQTKLLPNLIFASKWICAEKSGNESYSSSSSANTAAFNVPPENIVIKKLSDLAVDQMKTLTSLLKLVCHLIHLNEQFLAQFCDSHFIATDLLIHLLSDIVHNPMGTQLLCTITAMLCLVLRESPENAEIVETILFHSNVKIVTLLKHESAVLRSRVCKLLRIVGRFSCFALQKAWSLEYNLALEALLNDENESVKTVRKKFEQILAAKHTIKEFSYHTFYQIAE